MTTRTLPRSVNRGMVTGIYLSIQLICLRSHDEIIFVQSANLMRPKLDCDSSPLGDEQRMMSFLFRDHADFVCEFQSLSKVFEFEALLQTLHSVHFLNFPLMD